MIKRVVPFDMLAPFLREQMDDGAMITAIRNAWIVTQDASRRIIRGDVVIDGERIVSVGPAYNGTADREIDATGDIVMPGMINTHTHVAMSVMKGVVDDLLFPDFLDKVFKIDSDRTDEDMDIGTKLGCMEMMRGGTTTFMDLYYSEDVIAKATQQAGIRGVVGVYSIRSAPPRSETPCRTAGTSMTVSRMSARSFPGSVFRESTSVTRRPVSGPRSSPIRSVHP